MHPTLRGAMGIVLLLIACCVTQAATIEGMWRSTGTGEKTRLQLMWGEGNHHNHSTMGISAGEPAPLRSSSTGPVTFEIVREAGTIHFDGRRKGTSAMGDFTFTPDPAALQRLAASGIDVSQRERKSRRRPKSPDEVLFQLALFDVSSAYSEELRSLGYSKLSLDDLIAMRIHRVDAEYIRSLQRAGYSNLDRDTLMSMGIHGVTPAFIQEMKLLGFENVSSDDVVSSRIHGVTPEFVREMRELGFEDLSLDDLTSMRIHGVTPEYVREMRAAGFEDITADELVKMKIHGIDSRYTRAMKKSGKRN